MDSLKTLQTNVQTALSSPAVKKLRALEQTRMARITAKHAASRARVVSTLEHLDAASKSALSDAVTRRAEDLRAQAQDLADLVDAIKGDDADATAAAAAPK